jgi:hypothetical protein
MGACRSTCTSAAPGFEHLRHAEYSKLLRDKVVEEKTAAERREKGIKLLGRKAVLQQPHPGHQPHVQLSNLGEVLFNLVAQAGGREQYVPEMQRLFFLGCFFVLTVLGCGQSQTAAVQEAGSGSVTDAGSISVTRVASAADLDAFLKAWCDCDVRCTSDFPIELCDERRNSIGNPELYAAEPLAAATACFPTLSCEKNADECIPVAAMATAQSSSSRAARLSSCAQRAEECTGEGELQLMDCYWFMLFSEDLQPRIEACWNLSCSQFRSCAAGLRQ